MAWEHQGVDPGPFEQHPFKAVCAHVWRMPFLRNIFLVCLFVALFFPLYNWSYLSPVNRKMLTTLKIQDAERMTSHLAHILDLGGRPISDTTMGPIQGAFINRFRADFNIQKLKLFAPSGQVVYSTEASEVGEVNTFAYFSDVVAQGRIYARVATHGQTSSEGKPLDRDVVEIYVPIMKAQNFFGAFEIYYDITQNQAELLAMVRRTQTTLILIAAIMMAIVAVILFKAGQALLSHKRMDEALQAAREQLERRVAERTAELLASNKELLVENTERRQAEENLSKSERRFRSLVETIPHCIQEIDARGTITFANPSHQKVYGYNECDLVGNPIYYLAADEENRRQVEAHFNYLMKVQPSPAPWYSDDRTQSGQIIQTQVDWNYKRDTQGRVEGLIAVISEITHRKQAEKALLDNLNFMNTLIDTIPNPVFYKDAQGVYLGCNMAYAQTLGQAKEAIMGRRLIDLPVSEHSEMAWHYHQQDLLMMEKSGVQSHEMKIRCADGVDRDYIMYKATFEDTEGHVAGLVGIMLDISARIQDEKDRQQLELQLQQAQKMEALGTLAGGIAHDFNNILTAIIGYGELAAAETQKQTQTHHYLQRVLEAGERARALVKQILAFSRQSDNQPRPVQIKIIVKEVLKLLRASLPVTIDIVQNINSDAAVMADPVQIHQVMMNLCTNAGYAMREKGGCLTAGLENVTLDDDFISKHKGLKAGDYILLSVIDTGVGIAPEHLSRIFDPFFTTKPKGQGTGLGLSVVHGIVTKLQGLITVESKPGEGARFHVYLPALEDKGATAYSENSTLPTGSERVLFVDDEVMQSEMIMHMLSLLGYKVQTMSSSLEALTWFEKDPSAVDLVITDMIMPQMSGDEMARRMLGLRPDLPMIMCTGYSDTFTEVEAKALGFRAYVLKPLMMDELARLIRRILDEVPEK
jgi:two-component system cell cycle sensor histidine kinase/response regulator CckA